MRDKQKQKIAQHRSYINTKAACQERNRQRRLARRAWFNALVAGRKCKECGEAHPACLDFHHRNPEEKRDTVNKLLAGFRSKAVILLEIAKCDVLCANCHRKFHQRVV